MAEYNIAEAFRRIEDELIQSLIRNLIKHKAEETDEGFDWDMWQMVQLKELEKYRKKNAKKFNGEFRDINKAVVDVFRESEQEGAEAILWDELDVKKPETKVNTKKVDALIDATVSDLEKAEYAVLRKANDEYRQIIYNAQMYASTGGTYEQAVDMATKDFLRRGITSIVYKNGSRHTIQDYARMAIRTGQKRAYLMGLGAQMKALGIHTVRVNRRTGACPYCTRWIGRVLIDDVYGGGTKEEAQKKGLPLLSTAIDEGFLHPNCKDIYSMYVEGVSEKVKPYSKKEKLRLAKEYSLEQEIERAKGIAESYKRMADNMLDDAMKEKYRVLQGRWEKKAEELAIKAGVAKDSEAFKDSYTLEGFIDENLGNEEFVKIGRKSMSQIEDIWHDIRIGKELELLKEEPIESAVENIRKNLSASTLEGWFRSADSDYKKKLVGEILGNEGTLNSGLNIAYYNYAMSTDNPLPFDEWVNTPMTLYRGQKKARNLVDSDVFVSYTADIEIARKHGDAIYEITLRPIDTLGSYQTTTEQEYLVLRKRLNNSLGKVKNE